MTTATEHRSAHPRADEQPAWHGALSAFLRDRVGDGADVPRDLLRSQEGWTPPPGVQVLHLAVPGTDGLPVRVYRPAPGSGTTPSGSGLLWFHGGGFVGGSLDWGEAHALSCELVARTGALVASVGYRTRTYRHAAQDASAAWGWFAAHAAGLGATGDLAVGGASAGANLALSLAAGHLDPVRTGHGDAGSGVRPAAFLGAYGLYHAQVEPVDPATGALMDELPEGLRFRPAGAAARTAALREGTDHPWAAVPGDGDLRRVPPATLVDCELDDLRPSSERLARQLRELGTPVRVQHAAGVLHGHLNWLPGPALPQVEQTIDHLARSLRRPDGC